MAARDSVDQGSPRKPDARDGILPMLAIKIEDLAKSERKSLREFFNRYFPFLARDVLPRLHIFKTELAASDDQEIKPAVIDDRNNIRLRGIKSRVRIRAPSARRKTPSTLPPPS